MEQLQTLVRWAALGFLTSLAVIIFAKLLFGSISLRGLLTGDRKGGAEYFSVGRTQLLILTLFVAVSYVRDMLLNSCSSVPDIPTRALLWLVGSQLFYLAGKARALWFNPSDQDPNPTERE